MLKAFHRTHAEVTDAGHFFWQEQAQAKARQFGEYRVALSVQCQRYCTAVGNRPADILAYHGISLDEHVFYCGVLPDYKALFRKIIQELQLCRYGYEDYIASLFNDILLLVDRQQHEQKKATGDVQEQIERAAAYFNENYNTKISIDDYAESLHISTNWFIHNFKQYAGMSPAQYILSLRMVNAQSLLERTTYNIKEISEIVGYENPLYFSRVFKKEIGKSPAQYRKERATEETV